MCLFLTAYSPKMYCKTKTANLIFLSPKVYFSSWMNRKLLLKQESLHFYLERCVRWDRSHQCWYIEWSSHQNPTRWDIRRCSTKLPKLTFLSWKVNPPHAWPLLPVNSWGSSLSMEKRGKINLNLSKWSFVQIFHLIVTSSLSRSVWISKFSSS